MSQLIQGRVLQQIILSSIPTDHDVSGSLVSLFINQVIAFGSIYCDSVCYTDSEFNPILKKLQDLTHMSSCSRWDTKTGKIIS